MTKEEKASQKFTKKNTILIALASMLVGVILTLSVVNVVQKQSQSANKTDLSKVEKVFNQLTTRYYKKVSKKELEDGAIAGMLDALGDPYSTALNDSQTQQVNQTITGTNFGGVGVTVVKKNNEVVIDSIMPDTPAGKSILKPNDIIVKVDNVNLKDGDINKASSLIRGKVKTKVKLTVRRAGKEISVVLTRAKITQSSVSAKELSKTVGYVSISQFDANTGSDLNKVLRKFEKAGLRSVILDVRGNPGGVMDAALTSASLFVKNGKVIMQYQEKNTKPEVIKANKKIRGGKVVTLKPIVLIDGSSASAAEIFAAALKQSAGATLVGQTSYGKGTVQEVNTVDKNNEYKYTVAKWLTPNGTWINKKGIKPDVAVGVPSYLKLTGFSSGETLKPKTMGLDVSVLQQYLTTLGYLGNHLTGIFDDQTVAAVKIFQQKNGLPVNGIVDETNQNKLYELLAIKAQTDDQTMAKALEIADK